MHLNFRRRTDGRGASTFIGIVPIKPENAAVVHRHDQLIGIDDNQPVWMLESEAGRRVGFAAVAESAICRSLLPEVIRAQRD
jgi:hypothetical protein